jgi:hypothetical protein
VLLVYFQPNGFAYRSILQLLLPQHSSAAPTAASIGCSYRSIPSAAPAAPTAASIGCSYCSIHRMLLPQHPSAAPTAASIGCSYRSIHLLLLPQHPIGCSSHSFQHSSNGLVPVNVLPLNGTHPSSLASAATGLGSINLVAVASRAVDFTIPRMASFT